jgi:hypothetical protein
MTHLAKEETAAQALAVVQARFERPSLIDIEDILERAKRQARVLAPQPDACDGPPIPLQVPSRIRALPRPIRT